MIKIDGSLFSGSGTILRYAVALATIISEPIRINKIRAKRDKPGLRPQHLQALHACCSISGGCLEGDEVNSTEIVYWPGKIIKGGSFEWDIGTAGSTTMLAFTLIPLALFAKSPSQFTILGGLFQDFAPSAFHMQKVLIPLVQRMGANIRFEILKPGYVPKGGGQLGLEVKPLERPLILLQMINQGKVKEIRGISLSSHLEKEKVSERMAEYAINLLERYGLKVQCEVLHDKTASQKGAALLLWAETETGCLLGADQAGRPGRKSEAIARFVAHSLREDLQTGATTDRHGADQLILFAALAKGITKYRIPRITDHIESNLYLVGKILGAKTKLEGGNLSIEGIGFPPRAG